MMCSKPGKSVFGWEFRLAFVCLERSINSSIANFNCDEYIGRLRGPVSVIDVNPPGCYYLVDSEIDFSIRLDQFLEAERRKMNRGMLECSEEI